MERGVTTSLFRRAGGAKGIAWCLWVALLVGVPPALSPFSGWSHDYASFSFSRLYLFLAIGALAGILIIVVCETRLPRLSTTKGLLVLTVFGAVCTLALAAASWAALFLAERNWAPMWAWVLSGNSGPSLVLAFAFFGAMGCLICAWFVLISAEEVGKSSNYEFHIFIAETSNHIETPRASSGSLLRPRIIWTALALLLMVGALRMGAWAHAAPKETMYSIEPAVGYRLSGSGFFWISLPGVTSGLTSLLALCFIRDALAARLKGVCTDFSREENAAESFKATGTTSPSDSKVRLAGLYSLVLSVPCLGELLCRFLLRLVPALSYAMAGAWPVLFSAQLASLVVFGVLVVRGAAMAGPLGVPGPSPSWRSPLDSWLSDQGLSERETEVVMLQASEGLSSVKIAERLGLSPATVRTFQARARKKLGVSSGDELVELVRGQQPNACPTQVESAVRDSREESSVCGMCDDEPDANVPCCLAPVIVVVLVAAILLPMFLWRDGAKTTWADGWLTPFSLAGGLMGAAILCWAAEVVGRCCGDTMSAGFEGSLDISHMVRRAIPFVALFMLVPYLNYKFLLVTGSVLDLELWVRPAASLGLATSACLAALWLLTVARRHEATLALTPSPAFRRLSPGLEQAAFPAAAFVVGLLVSELWKGSAWAFSSQINVFLPYLALLTVGGVVIMWLSMDTAARLVEAVSIVMALVLLHFTHSANVLLLCLAVHAVFLWRFWRTDVHLPPLPLRSMVLMFGFGMFVSLTLLSSISHLSEGALYFSILELDAIHLQSGLSYGVGVASLVALGALVASVSGLRQRLDALRVIGSFPKLGEDRVIAYLKTRGLSELQARIMWLALTGRSRSEICCDLHVAPGTVNAARHGCYQLFGVRSIVQLASHLAGMFCL